MARGGTSLLRRKLQRDGPAEPEEDASGGGCESPERENMSRGERLRRVVTERLSAAAGDVLAAVESAVAGYEEEATGFRREIERQRRQLERLQRRADELLPELLSHEVVVVGEEEEQNTEGHGPPGEASNEGAEPAALLRLNLEEPKEPKEPRCGKKPPGEKKSSSLRKLISRRLTAAAGEVLAAVERAAGDYEREARGLREEIDRQRSRLELLQPPDLQDRTAGQRSTGGTAIGPFLLPELQTEEVVVVVGEEEEQQPSAGADGAAGHCLPLDEEDGADDDDGDEYNNRPPAKPSGAKREELTDPDYEMPTRSSPVRGRRPGRPRGGGAQNRLTLRIRILEDSGTTVLSKAVFQRSPVQDLQCPRGLRELDFMDLLRSSFPQLAAGQPFDIFVATKKRQLNPLLVKTLTPEEIHANHRSSGNPTLYVRLKEREDRPSADPVVIERDEPGLHTRPVESTDITETVENGSADGCRKPDPKHPTPKRSRKRTEKPALKRTKEGTLSCRVCGAWYRQLGSLISHVWSHADDPLCVCGACGETLDSADALKEHLRHHQKVHSCQICGKAFVSVHSLKLHVAKHTGESRFKCRICDKSFTNTASLSYHQWAHVDDKPHKCDVCLKAFGLASHLASHRKLHAAEETHACDVCGRAFRLRRAMTQHRLTHSDDRRYACGVCGKRFRLEGSLKVHRKTHAERERAFLCHVCCRTFLWKATLMAHLKTHGGERPFVCAACGKGFWFRCDLKKHARLHSDDAPFQCGECGRRFKQKANLDSHVRIHLGIKSFVCGVCGKECSRREHLKVHMRTHSGDKPYVCPFCSRAFTQSHCLKTHMKSHGAGQDQNLDPDLSQSHGAGQDQNLDPDLSQSHGAGQDQNLDPSQSHGREEDADPDLSQSHGTGQNPQSHKNPDLELDPSQNLDVDSSSSPQMEVDTELDPSESWTDKA